LNFSGVRACWPPFSGGFCGWLVPHEKPLRFRAGPAGAAPAFMDCGDMSPLSKRRPVGAVQRRIRHPGRTSSASALNPGLNDGIPLGFYRTPCLRPAFLNRHAGIKARRMAMKRLIVLDEARARVLPLKD